MSSRNQFEYMEQQSQVRILRRSQTDKQVFELFLTVLLIQGRDSLEELWYCVLQELHGVLHPLERPHHRVEGLHVLLCLRQGPGIVVEDATGVLATEIALEKDRTTYTCWPCTFFEILSYVTPHR